MNRIRMGTGFLLAASLGLTGAIACGNASPASGGGASSGEQPWTSGDASTSAEAGQDAQSDGGAQPAFQITDCSAGQQVAILVAMNTAEINEATLALSLTTNQDVKAFANRMLEDHTTLAAQVSAYLTSSGVMPVVGDISIQLTAMATAELQALRVSTQFDRDYTVAQIIDHLTALSFLEHVITVPQGQNNGPLAMIFAGAQTVIQQHTQLAFALEQKVIGACGTAPVNDAGSCGDAMTGDAAVEDAGAQVDAAVTVPDAGQAQNGDAGCDGAMSCPRWL